MGCAGGMSFQKLWEIQKQTYRVDDDQVRNLQWLLFLPVYLFFLRRQSQSRVRKAGKTMNLLTLFLWNRNPFYYQSQSVFSSISCFNIQRFDEGFPRFFDLRRFDEFLWQDNPCLLRFHRFLFNNSISRVLLTFLDFYLLSRSSPGELASGSFVWLIVCWPACFAYSVRLYAVVPV